MYKLLLAEDEDSVRESMKEGVPLAAEEHKCELLYNAPQNEGDYAVQLIMAAVYRRLHSSLNINKNSQSEKELPFLIGCN